MSRFGIDETQRPQTMAILCDQWRATIEPDIHVARYKGVIANSFVLGRIRDVKHVITQDRIATKRQIALRFRSFQPT